MVFAKTSQSRNVHAACWELTQDWLSGLAKDSTETNVGLNA